MKPSNTLLVEEERRFRLIDLGACADLRQGTNYTPTETILDAMYCPPEQVRSCPAVCAVAPSWLLPHRLSGRLPGPAVTDGSTDTIRHRASCERAVCSHLEQQVSLCCLIKHVGRMLAHEIVPAALQHADFHGRAPALCCQPHVRGHRSIAAIASFLIAWRHKWSGCR